MVDKALANMGIGPELRQCPRGWGGEEIWAQGLGAGAVRRGAGGLYMVLTVLALRVMKLASNLAKYSKATTDRACQYAGCRAPMNALTFCPMFREAVPSALALSAASATSASQL